MTVAFPPSIELTRLYEKTSQRGTRYFVGRLCLARIALLPGVAAEDGTATWRMLLQEAPKASTDRQASNESRARSPGTRRRQAASPVVGASMPDDSVADLWAGPVP
jgi:hypothetical protein